MIKDWTTTLYAVIHATNPVLPNPDRTAFISKNKTKGYTFIAFRWLNRFGPFEHTLSVTELMEQVYPKGMGNKIATRLIMNHNED